VKARVMKVKVQANFVTLSLALLLTACGESPQAALAPAQAQAQATAADAPASALGTTAAYARFAASLPTTETGKPSDINSFTPPTSETAEAVPVR
jgi:uncharacterized lipoprotein YbaY